MDCSLGPVHFQPHSQPVALTLILLTFCYLACIVLMDCQHDLVWSIHRLDWDVSISHIVVVLDWIILFNLVIDCSWIMVWDFRSFWIFVYFVICLVDILISCLNIYVDLSRFVTFIVVMLLGIILLLMWRFY